MAEKILAWHFLQPDGRIRTYGRMHTKRPKIEVGRTYTVRPPIELCGNGLHASKTVWQALSYAQSSLISRVEMGGEIRMGDDKMCATRRTVLAIGDIEAILHEFSCRVAEDALTVAKVEDKRSLAAIETKRRWLKGEATDEELDAARDAAWAAARAAARDAAWDAAWDAARAAAWDAARAAARDAARDAARAAAWAAASAAARDVAWDAAIQKYEKWLDEMVLVHLGLALEVTP